MYRIKSTVSDSILSQDSKFLKSKYNIANAKYPRTYIKFIFFV